ncbi:MAG: TIGR02300 family protein [Pseudomonadota bacterium]
MPKEEWGTKRLCPTTGKRFYDMNRSPIVSPYTGDVVELDSSKTRMIAADAADAATTKAKVATAAAEGEEQVIDEEDVEVELDDDLLDDDEDEDSVPLEELADVAAEDDET